MKKFFTVLAAILLISSTAVAGQTKTFLAHEGLMSGRVVNTGTNSIYSDAFGFPAALSPNEYGDYLIDLLPGDSATVYYDMNEYGDVCEVNFYNKGQSGRNSDVEVIQVSVYGNNRDTSCEITSKGDLRLGSWAAGWDNCWNDWYCMKASANKRSHSIVKPSSKVAAKMVAVKVVVAKKAAA